MTRKDYVMLAQVIAKRKENDANLGVLGYSERDLEVAQLILDDLANFLAAALAQDNPYFQRERFLTACGVVA